MSSMRPPVRPQRVEPVLLSLLRKRFSNVVFASMRDRTNPVAECVIVAEPGQQVTPVSQYVRVRVSVWCRRDDGTGDFQAAQELAADIESYLTGLYPPRPVITIEHESGPIRMTDENNTIMAYLVLLLQVETT